MSFIEYYGSPVFRDIMRLHYEGVAPSYPDWSGILRYGTINPECHLDSLEILRAPNWVQWQQDELNFAVMTSNDRIVRLFLARGVLPINGGQQTIVPGHTLLCACVILNRLPMARLLLREVGEDIHRQSMDADTLVLYCVQYNRGAMRQLLRDEAGV